MADVPDAIVLARHRDLEGRLGFIWVRRALVAAFALVPLLALLNAFGQRPSTSVADSAAARLEVSAPSRVRGGLLYTTRFRIDARRDLEDATLVLADGWVEGMTLNTLEPSPESESSENGRLALHLGRVPAGQVHELWLAVQVNPTNVGRRSQDVVLRDGPAQLVTVSRTVTVFP
jgi:hypothetical protein